MKKTIKTIYSIDEEIVNQIYENIFLKIKNIGVELFLCGGASKKNNPSVRDQLKDKIKTLDNISVFYPEDLFAELLGKKKYELLGLELFLANNSEVLQLMMAW